MDEKNIRILYTQLFGLCVSNYKKPESERLLDYYKAQDIILSSIQSLENQIYKLKKAGELKRSSEIIRLRNRIILFKDFGNTIAWHLIGENETDLRAYFGAGPNNGLLKDKNLQSELKIVDEFKDRPNAFIFLCDLSTMINIGDVMIKKVGYPPMTLEMKEGNTNNELMKILHDEDSTNKYIEALEPSKRKTTETHVKRLISQKKRMDDLNAYMRDDSSRYSEKHDINIMIIKPKKHIQTTYFTNQLNRTYRNLEPGGIKTIKIRGGLYALVTKRPENDDDNIHFRHMVYHKINNLNFSSDCMINATDHNSASVINELNFIKNADTYTTLSSLGVGWFKPLPASLEDLDEDFALSLLNRDSSLYFTIDPIEFLSYLQKYGMTYELKKRSGLPGEANGTFLVNGKRVLVNGVASLSTNFIERMVRSFHRPTYEIKMLKEMILRAENITDSELERFAKDR